MNFELDIVKKIKAEEKNLTTLEYKKKSTKNISQDACIGITVSIEQKKYYIKGLRDALTCIQKKRD